MAELKLIQSEVHKLATEKGWHTTEASLPARLMLVVCEVAEAVEELRDDQPAIYQYKATKDPQTNNVIKLFPNSPDWDKNVKPEGTLIELADATIRILDICESQGWDLENAIRIKHAYNKTRPYLHGGKKF